MLLNTFIFFTFAALVLSSQAANSTRPVAKGLNVAKQQLTNGARQIEKVESATESAEWREKSNDDKSQSDEVVSIAASDADKKLYKRLFVQRRKEHAKAVQSIEKMSKYELRYNMVNIVLDTIIEVIESRRLLLNSVTDDQLTRTTFMNATSEEDAEFVDAISNVLENAALFAEIVWKQPDMARLFFKIKEKLSETISWSFGFVERCRFLLDDTTLEKIHLASQELEIIEREPGYSNPNSQIGPRNSDKESKKKKKKKKGPVMAKYEL
ncbi:coiled-coil domain-containing protein 134-like [Trichogramma pretiosum]|uniref:coiled-coil domain-containing protein 134-like n=1 Tax=Trichogramma pretiosum TaxID=7493 RepID=UPI0006C96C27|nr:coiled-coil domain-containing protein 134-like [Trichogramma pretiosum]XP_023317739.1 coiled-coil domain-containing protein 134-like [Trichogramma pretiosum]